MRVDLLHRRWRPPVVVQVDCPAEPLDPGAPELPLEGWGRAGLEDEQMVKEGSSKGLALGNMVKSFS